MPIITLAEIDSTGRKAARGCGCPWGLAEEAGKSARWLAAHGQPGVSALAAMLSNRAGCCTQTGRPCALALGTALADRATALTEQPATIGDVDIPLIAIAQMGRAADALNHAYLLEGAGGEARVARHSLTLSGDIEPSTMTCTATESAPQIPPPSPASRDVDDIAWASLTQMSHRLLVPASEESRAGAGAGSSDND